MTDEEKAKASVSPAAERWELKRMPLENDPGLAYGRPVPEHQRGARDRPLHPPSKPKAPMTDEQKANAGAPPAADRWGLKPVPLEKIQRMYARADHWPLEDAVRLLINLPPRALAPEAEDAETRRRVSYVMDIARNCLGHSLPEAPGLPAHATEPRVRPIDALRWAVSTGGGAPKNLAAAVREYAETKGPVDQPKTRTLLPKQVHRHRCAAIAALLWKSEPELPVAQMAKRPELVSAGCEGKTYAQDTLEKWIRSEKPGGTKPGRPKKHD